jgi:ubiquinone/menaquinone biosynthesis C-methylase UbiE
VNENHARVCGGPEWAAHLQADVLPVVTRDADLGQHMLEIGPGPGAATEWLRGRVTRLTAVEIDQEAASALAVRFPDVEVVTADATDLPYPDESFDSVGTFTALHHVPTRAGQDKLLAEALRVLRPGGTLVGSDSLPSDGLHHFHEGDVYNPVEPGTLLTRLQTIGFAAVMVMVDGTLMFRARRAAAA